MTSNVTRDRLAVEAARAKRLDARARSQVYLIYNSSGHVKIGVSLNPHKRLRTLQCGSSDALQLLLTIPGTRTLERRLHRRFHQRRVTGEWFALTPDDYQAIQELRTQILTGELAPEKPPPEAQRLLVDVITTYRRTVVVEVQGDEERTSQALEDYLRTRHLSLWPKELVRVEGSEVMDVRVEVTEEPDREGLFESEPHLRIVQGEGGLTIG